MAVEINFTGLLAQYKECKDYGKMYLVKTPSGLAVRCDNCVRRWFDTYFRGHSYYLSKSAKLLCAGVQTLIDKASELSSTEKSPPFEAELAAAIKIIKITTAMLSHTLEKPKTPRIHLLPKRMRKFLFSLNKFFTGVISFLKIIKIAKILFGSVFENSRNSTKRLIYQASQKFLSSKINTIASLLGKLQNRSPVLILHTYKCYAQLFESITSGYGLSDGEVPRNTLENILQLACEANKIDVAYSLVKKKVSTKILHDANPAFLAGIAREAWAATDDESLSLLIDEQEFLRKDTQLYIGAIQRKMTRSVATFIEKGASLSHTDEEKNTPLHAAFLSGNIGLIRMLSQHYDPLEMNAFHQTPFRALLYPKGLNCDKPSLPSDKGKEFLNELFVRSKNDPPMLVIEEIDRLTQGLIPKGTQCDLLETLFLLGEPPQEKHFSWITREYLEKSITYLAKKYPKASTYAFFASFFSLNKTPLQRPGDGISLPKEAPKNVSANTLLTLFDSLPWETIDAAVLLAQVGEKDHSPDDPQGQLREILSTFLKKIEERKCFEKPPSGKESQKEFYFQIDLCLRHIISRLLDSNNTAGKIRFMKEMLTIAQSDGWRIHHKMLKQYQHICCNTEENAKEFFERLLINFKRIILDEALKERYGESSDYYDQAAKDLSERLGVPPLASNHETLQPDRKYDKESIVHTFYEKATPQTFLFDYLLPLYAHDAEVRDVCRETLKEFMPSSWTNDPSGTQRTKNLIVLLEHLGLFRSTLNSLSPQKIVPALTRTRSFMELLSRKRH